jgi:hypothetical protein
MANTFDGSGSIDGITAAWEKLTKAVGESVSVLEEYKKAAKLPSQYVAELEKVKKANEQIKNSFINLSNAQDQYKANLREEKRLQKSLSDTKAKAAKVDSEVSRSQIKHNEALKERRKLLREEARLTNTATSVYDKIQAKVNVLTREYNNLAAKQELGIKLRDKEIQRLEWAEKKLNGYQTVLKSVDKRIGRHTRNVGNYASAYDGLGWSIAQITREAPAFAHNLTTGFMAISNNIPMLVDEINRLKIANKELIAQGQPTVNVFKRVAGAFFSWQTLISAGIVLLTVYGKDIVESIFKTDAATEATRKYNKEIEEQNKSLKENIRLRRNQIKGLKNFIDSKNLIDEFSKALNNSNSETERSEALLGELADRLSEVGSQDTSLLKDDKIALTDRLVIAGNILQIQTQQNLLDQERLRVNNLVRKEQEILEKFKKGEISETRKNIALQDLTNFNLSETIKIQQRINQLRTANNEIANRYVELTSESLNNAKKENDIIKERVQLVGDFGSKAFIEAQIQGLKEQLEVTAKLDKGTGEVAEEYKKIQNELDFWQGKLDRIYETTEDVVEKTKEIEFDWTEIDKGLAKMDALREKTDRWLESFSMEAFDNAGMGSLADVFSSEFQDILSGAHTWQEEFAVVFNAASEIAQDSFQLINQFSQQLFENQLIQAEQSRDIALQFAGESAEARAAIQEQYEERRREIQIKQAKEEKQNAIFNIIIDTSQGIVAALSQANPALAFAIGAIGAAQLGIVKSQKIPQFAEGTRDFGGGLAVVGDGGKSEIVTTPKGDVYKTPSKDTLVNLPKGANVYSSEQEYQNELNNILSSNGILQSSPIVMVSSKSDNKLYEKLDSLEKTVKNKNGLIINLDENGFKKSLTKGNARTNILNNRVSFRGSEV